MSTLRLILRELAGMFVDDGDLALSILVVVALAALAAGVAAPALVTGGVLCVGCALVLIWNAWAATRKDRGG